MMMMDFEKEEEEHVDIFFSASDISTALGKNAYTQTYELVDRVWQRLGRGALYRAAVFRVKNRGGQVVETAKEQEAAVAAHRGFQAFVKETEKNVLSGRKECVALLRLAESKFRHLKEKDMLLDACRSHVFQLYGRQKEEEFVTSHNRYAEALVREAEEKDKKEMRLPTKAETKTEQKQKQTIHPDHRMIVDGNADFKSKVLGLLELDPEGENILTWGIGGKVDGLQGDDTVIELKHRQRSTGPEAGSEAPIADVLQLLSYLVMTNRPYGILIERGENAQGPTERRTRIHYAEGTDMEKLWVTEVIPALRTFVSRFGILLSREDLQEQWLVNNGMFRREMWNNMEHFVPEGKRSVRTRVFKSVSSSSSSSTTSTTSNVQNEITRFPTQEMLFASEFDTAAFQRWLIALAKTRGQTLPAAMHTGRITNIRATALFTNQ